MLVANNFLKRISESYYESTKTVDHFAASLLICCIHSKLLAVLPDVGLLACSEESHHTVLWVFIS